MAGLFLRTADAAAGLAPDALDAAAAQFARHGFPAVAPFAVAGWDGLHAPYIRGGPETWLARGEDRVAVAGTLVVDGRMGAEALALLLDAGDPTRLDWSRIGGQFVALLHRAGRTFLFTDWFGAFQLFHDADARVFSTSLLAALAALPQVRFSAQGVYEFAFNVMPIGDDTVFEGLSTLGPDRIVELTPDGARFHPVTRSLPRDAARMAMPERIARARAHLSDIVGAHVAAFGDDIRCPLSGGIDSRLLYAALRHEGAAPHLYVYGPPGSDDVTIAQAIGAGEGVAVEWINKALVTIAPDAFPAQVAAEFEAWDALPTYGNIFDAGGHSAACAKRHQDGALAASGGCGEIYRDFFYLPDRATTADAVARTFFARFLPADTTNLFDVEAFIARVATKIGAAVGAAPRERLDRQTVEHLYPKVRCRALFGREISLEARHGAYLMPFLDHRVVAEAMTLPVGMKQAGRFEAALLAAIDPVLAAYPSAYGHDFAGPPSPRHRFQEWSSRIRPAWLRQRSYAIQRRIGAMADEHGGLLSPDYLGRVIDLNYPAMRRFFRMEAITDSGLLRRIACLEYLAQRLGSRLR